MRRFVSFVMAVALLLGAVGVLAGSASAASPAEWRIVLTTYVEARNRYTADAQCFDSGYVYVTTDGRTLGKDYFGKNKVIGRVGDRTWECQKSATVRVKANNKRYYTVALADGRIEDSRSSMVRDGWVLYLSQSV